MWDKIANDERVEEERKSALTNEDLISLWGQLILTANAFGVLCIEKKSYDLALEILQKCERWNRRTDILPKVSIGHLILKSLFLWAFGG